MGFAMMLCGWAVMETRLPPLMSVRNGGWRKVKWFDLSAFKTPSYTLFCVGATTLFLGLYNLFTYVETFGNDYQIPATTYLLPILNAVSCHLSVRFCLWPFSDEVALFKASTFGRIIPGFYADKIGRFNMLIPTLFGASIVLYFWPLAKDLGGILPILILYGAFSGVSRFRWQ
jgi:MFS transporter, MCT family, solute carrier family 16 (monocarboxylic acid transporters), member 10